MKRFLILCVSVMMFVCTISVSPSYAFNADDLDEFTNTLYCEGCDLSGANLNDQDLSASFLVDTDLSNANLSGSYLAQVHWQNVNLSNADLSRSLFVESELQDVDLSGVKLIEAEFYNNWIEGVDLTGADLTDAVADEETLSFNAKLCNTTMSQGNVESNGC